MTFLEMEPIQTATADAAGTESVGGGNPVLNEPSDLAGAGQVADAFAAADAARMAELDRLIKRGKGDKAPKDLEEEKTMATCSVCGKPGHNARSCGKTSKPEPKPGVEVAPAPKKERPAKVAAKGVFCDPTTLTVEQLVQTIEACRLELADRRVALQAQLDQVVEALGVAA